MSRNPRAREVWTASALVLLLVALTATATITQTSEEGLPPMASRSTEENGVRALWLWLDRAGYDVGDQVAAEFEIPEGTDVVLMFEPRPFPGITDSEWETLDTWVRAGGTLIISGNNLRSLSVALNHFEIDVNVLQPSGSQITPAHPLVNAPLIAAPIQTRTSYGLETARSDFLPLFISGGEPVSGQITEGEGRVLVATTGRSFTNLGLQTPGSAEMVLNLIAGIPEGGSIWFDEWHHGKRIQQGSTEILGPGNWLRRTPAGHALLFVAAVVFIGIVLSGKSFGRPIPTRQESVRRAPLEYVSALANLSRRAGHKKATLAHYHDQIKRHYGRRYRIDPGLPDRIFIDTLAQYAPHLDIRQIGNLLTRLRNPNISENEVVQLTGEAADLVEE